MVKGGQLSWRKEAQCGVLREGAWEGPQLHGGASGPQAVLWNGPGLLGVASWGRGLHCPALLTPELSVLMALTCRQSSVNWLVLLASALSSERWPPGSVPASGSPFSLSNRARRCTSLRCFLVT